MHTGQSQNAVDLPLPGVRDWQNASRLALPGVRDW
jgi:hypothetical protein